MSISCSGDIAASGEQLIVDSRLAWHFFTDALKVHLITEPTVAAQRVLGRPADSVEGYARVEEARCRLAVRSESERIGSSPDTAWTRPDCATTTWCATAPAPHPDEIVERIIGHLQSSHVDARPSCYLDPKRIYPTVGVPSAAVAGEPIAVGHRAPFFFAVDGHQQLSAAIRAGRPLIAATLVAEDAEEIAGLRSDRYFAAHTTAVRVREWERAHDIRLPRIERTPTDR